MLTKTLSGSSVGAICRRSLRDSVELADRARERERTGIANAGQSVRLIDDKRRTAIRNHDQVHGLHTLSSGQLVLVLELLHPLKVADIFE